MNMLKVSAGLLALLPVLVSAEMQPLPDDALANADGQSGALISADMKLNLDASGNYDCAGDTAFCRIAFAANNRQDASGNTEWIVLKGVHGQVKIDDLRLDGVVGINGTQKNGIKLTFDPAKPIQVRNLGFDAISSEADYAPLATNPLNTAYPTEYGSGKGYFNPEFYGDYSTTADPNGKTGYNNVATYNVKQFDVGRETGFMGVNMHADLQINGSVTIYGYQP